MKILYLTFLLLFTISYSYAQESNQRFILSIGYGIEQPDPRLDYLKEYSYPVFEFVSNSQVSNHDMIYLELGYFQKITNRISSNLFLGVNRRHSDYNKPISHSFFNIRKLILLFNKSYISYNLRPSIELDYQVIRSPFETDLGLSFNSNQSFHKRVESRGERVDSKSKLEFSNLELFTNLKLKYKRIEIAMGYRIFNLVAKDDALVNNGVPYEFLNMPKANTFIRYYL